MIKAEVAVLSKCRHYAIIRFLDLYESPSFLYLVYELLQGGELFDRIVARGSYSENYAASAVRDILEGVKYLHDQRIMHRDLKPENLVYTSADDDATLKIGKRGNTQWSCLCAPFFRLQL